jgi:hypothetical protein
MKRALAIGVVGILAGVGLLLTRPALAATCNGTSVSGTGPVIVPSGATCTLTNTTVNAAIQVQPGGSLSLLNVTVAGTISAFQATNVDISNSSTKGISISESSPDAQNGWIFCGNTIAGQVSISKVAVDVVFGGTDCRGNDVCGSLSASRNTDITIENNTFAGSGSASYNITLNLVGNRFGGSLSTSNNELGTISNNTASDRNAAALRCTQPTGSSTPQDQFSWAT